MCHHFPCDETDYCDDPVLPPRDEHGCLTGCPYCPCPELEPCSSIPPNCRNIRKTEIEPGCPGCDECDDYVCPLPACPRPDCDYPVTPPADEHGCVGCPRCEPCPVPKCRQLPPNCIESHIVDIRPGCPGCPVCDRFCPMLDQCPPLPPNCQRVRHTETEPGCRGCDVCDDYVCPDLQCGVPDCEYPVLPPPDEHGCVGCPECVPCPVPGCVGLEPNCVESHVEDIRPGCPGCPVCDRYCPMMDECVPLPPNCQSIRETETEPGCRGCDVCDDYVCPDLQCGVPNCEHPVLPEPDEFGCPRCPYCCLALPCPPPPCDNPRQTTLPDGCPGCPVCDCPQIQCPPFFGFICLETRPTELSPGCPGCDKCISAVGCPLVKCPAPECDFPLTPRDENGCETGCPICPGNKCKEKEDLKCPINVHCQLTIPTTLPNGCPGCDLCCIDPAPQCSDCLRFAAAPGTCPTCDDCIQRAHCPKLECPPPSPSCDHVRPTMIKPGCPGCDECVDAGLNCPAVECPLPGFSCTAKVPTEISPGCRGCDECRAGSGCGTQGCPEVECDNPATPKNSAGCDLCPICLDEGECLEKSQLGCPEQIYCPVIIPTTQPNGCPGCDLCCDDPGRQCPDCESGEFAVGPGRCPTCDDCVRKPYCEEPKCDKKKHGCNGKWIPVTLPNGCPGCPRCVPASPWAWKKR